MAQAPLRLQLLDQPLEGHVLVGVGAQRRLPGPGPAARGRADPGRGRSRRTRVLTKKPISSSVSSRLRPAIGVPTTMSSCPVVAVEQRLERRQQHHEQRDALAGGQGGVSPLQRPARQLDGQRPPRRLRTAGRGRSVGSSSTGASPPSRSPPVAELALQHLPLQPSALPDGEVRILHRQLRQRRRLPADERRVQRRQLPDQDARRTSRRRRCGASSAGPDAPSRPAAARAARSSGPRARSNGRRASATASRRACSSRAAAREAAQVHHRRHHRRRRDRSPARAGRPPARTRVRSDSCRRTSSVRLRASAAGSSRPCSRRAAGML